jgi:hypothetical protein
MRPIFSLCSEGVALDRQSNNVTVYNVIEEITSVGFPLLIPKLFLLASFAREGGDPDEAQIRIRVTAGETEVFNQAMSIRFQGKSRTRVIIQLAGTTVPGVGSLCFEILAGDKKLTEYLIDVKAAEKPEMKVVEAEGSGPVDAIPPPVA